MKTYKVTVSSINTIRWYNEEGDRHREDGPAIEYADGSKTWYLNGKPHREGGPAVMHVEGYKEWIIHGLLHREDGPAIVTARGNKMWYLEGKSLSEAQFNKRVSKSKPGCTNRIITIEGKDYILTPKP